MNMIPVKGLLLGHPDTIMQRSTQFAQYCHDMYFAGQFIGGKYTRMVEQSMTEAMKAPTLTYGCATEAIRGVLRLVGRKKLIAPAMSFPSPVIAAAELGYACKVVDVHRNTIMMGDTVEDPENTVLLLSHFGGGMYRNSVQLVAKMKEQGVFVLEDFSHSYGAKMGDADAGCLGDVSVCSLFATKPLHMGNGALVVFNSHVEFLERMSSLRQYGRDDKAEGTCFISEPGGSSQRITEMQAALFLINSLDLEMVTDRRLWVLARYAEELPMFDFGEGVLTNGYRAYLRVTNPKQTRKWLFDQGVETVGAVYDAPIPDSILYEGHGITGDSLQAREFCGTHVCLPCHGFMSSSNTAKVIRTVKRGIEDNAIHVKH